MFLGDIARIRVDFYKENDDGDMVLTDPETIDLTIYTSDDTVVHEDTLNDEDHRLDEGKYEYQWSADQLGDFRFEFIATFDDTTTQTVNYYITVILPSDEDTSGDVLGEDYELEFSTSVDNVFGDVEYISEFFPDAKHVHILDILYRLSKDVISLKIRNPEDDPFVYEYVKLAALCELSRIYDTTGEGDEMSLSLGDFSIRTGSSESSETISAANASTWCELAWLLRRELFGAESRQFVKGGKVDNPMPERGLQRASKWGRRNRW